MVVDVFTYNGEKDILDLRLNILEPHVDKFIIVEAKTTFSGYKKPLYFSQQEKSFKKFWRKIDYHIIDEDYTDEEIRLAEQSPNTIGASHWKREFLQKESIKKALSGLQNDDICYIGDVDEIWEPVEVLTPLKLKLRVYAYYLNNRSSEDFWGTTVARYQDIKDSCLNHLRTDPNYRTVNYHGWHFTSMGGLPEVRRKLNDSYTPESYNTAEVQQLLPDRLRNGYDYLGRPFSFVRSTKDWPDYLKRNKRRYEKLMLERKYEQSPDN